MPWSAAGFRGDFGGPKLRDKSNYRASLVSPFPAVSGRVSLMLQRRSAFHGGKAQTPLRLFQGLSGAYSPFLLPRGGSGLDRKQPYQRHLAAGHPALHLGHLREGPVPDRRPDLLPPPHHQGRGGRRRHRRGQTWARSRGGYVPGVTSRRGRWCVPPRCTNPGRHRSHRASRPWRTGPRRHWIAWGDEPSPLMPASGRWRRRMAFPSSRRCRYAHPNLYRLSGVGADPSGGLAAVPRRTLTTVLRRRVITNLD